MKIRRRLFTSSAIAIGIALIFVTLIFADTYYRHPNKDTMCNVDSGQCYDGLGIYVKRRGNTSSCTSNYYVGYIGWDLAPDASKTWDSATLELFAYKRLGGSEDNNGHVNFEFTVYPANIDNWTENGTNPGFDETNPLAVVSADLTNASASNMVSVKFASDDLGTYFLNKKGHEATVAIVMTDGCGLGADVWFEDTNGTGGSAPTSANEPNLTFYTGPIVNGTPSAVAMKSIQTENNTTPFSPNWPVIAGLFALAAVVVVGIGYSVRRFKQS